MSVEETIREQIANNAIILYMKGTPEAPQCGFSATAVKAIKSTGFDYAYVNVLEQPFIRERLPKISEWPTFPQLFVAGELVGGSDIVEQLAADGELISMLKTATGQV